MLGWVRSGLFSGYKFWRLRLFYGLALAALALVVFGAYDSYPHITIKESFVLFW